MSNNENNENKSGLKVEASSFTVSEPLDDEQRALMYRAIINDMENFESEVQVQGTRKGGRGGMVMSELIAKSSGEIRARDALLGYWWYEKSEVDDQTAKLENQLNYKNGVAKRWFEQCMEARAENVRLKRMLWLTRASRAHGEQHWSAYVEYVHTHEKSFYEFDGDNIRSRDNKNNDSFLEWHNRWTSVERKCFAKAEVYK